MSLAEVVDDLITLEELAEHEEDPARRRSLEAVRDRVAQRNHGAKVSEAARSLNVSAPTARAWIEAGLLKQVDGARPIRIDVLSLATAKRAVELLRQHANDRHILAQVMRLLRDRAVLAGDGVREGFEDLAAGRVVPLTDELLAELSASPKVKKQSKSA